MAASARFEVGDVLRYGFAWRVDAADAAGLPGEMDLEAGLDLAGELELRVYPPHGADTVLGMTITRLDRHAITMMGQNALPGPEDLVGHESIVVVGPGGELRSTYFAPDAPSLVRHVVPGLLAQIDLRLPARDQPGATERVAAGAGVADVEYAWTSPTRLARTLRAYTRLDAYASGRKPVVDGRMEVELDEHGLPLRMDGGEILEVGSDQREDGGFRSRTTFTLERVAIAHERPRPTPALEGLVGRDPLAAPDDEEAQRVIARKFAAGLGPVDVEMAVHGAAAGLRASPDFIVRATGRLRGWPETAAELAPLFATYTEDGARSLVVDILASGGTAEAQAVMRDVLADPDVRARGKYGVWLQRFSFLWRPRPETAAFLLDEHTRALGEEDPLVRRGILYPMGTVAARVAAVDPVAAAALRTRLREALDAADTDDDLAAAIGGLGNAGAAEDVALVLAHAGAASPAVRAEVARALRTSTSPAATAALSRLLADSHPLVASVALSVLDERHAGVDDSLRLAAFALGGAYVPALAPRLTSALARRRDDDPWMRAALVAMRERTHDPRERNRIEAALGEP